MMMPLLLLPASALTTKAASIAACCAPLSVSTLLSALVAATDLVTSVAVARSLKSTSAKVIEPVSLSVVPSVMAPVTSTTASTGTSLVPCRVTVTSCVGVPPWPSLTVMVKIAVTVSPAARKSRLASVMV